jgi:cystathionine beta-lyase
MDRAVPENYSGDAPGFSKVIVEETMATDFDRIIDRRQSDSTKWRLYGDALAMWVADMDFLAPEPIIAALRARVEHGVFGYAAEPPELREVLAAWLKRRFDWTVATESIAVMPGVVSAFNVACRAFCEPGDGVLVQAPVYPPMRTGPGNFGLTRDEMELTRGADGRYTVDYGLMDATITPRTKLFLLCSPHNPTGRVFTRDELARMAEVSLARGLVICSDEIHCDLVYAPHRHTPIASMDPEIARRTVTLMAPSKTFNVPGLGFSFAIIENRELRKRYKAAAADIVPHVGPLGYAGALAAYTECDGWLEECIEYLRGNRDFLAAFVAERLPGVRMAPPEATYLAWLDFRDAALGEDPQRFFLKRAGVAMNECDPFGPGAAGFARLNFGCPRRMLAEGLARIEAALKQK